MKSLYNILLALTLPLAVGQGCNNDMALVFEKQDQVVEEVNSFGLEVFKDIYKSESDFISPLSLSSALSMTALGANGKTQEQMMEVVGFKGADPEEAGKFYHEYMRILAEADENTAFKAANSIWINGLISAKKDFVNACDDLYDAEVGVRNFGDPKTLAEINGWCSDKTEGKIESILDQLDNGSLMILLNALYFKGDWQFDKFGNAVKGDFTDISGKRVRRELMRTEKSFEYLENGDVQVVELPYGNGSFVMDVVLPAREKDFSEFVDGLDIKKWNEWMASLDRDFVNLKMPKFKLEYEVNLNDVLMGLGMKDAFSGKADFSAMSDTPLMIDFVKQKTYVDVNEYGTEAAAVTAIGMKAMSMGPVDSRTMIVDRPFVFAIREKSTGLLLFIGQYCG